MRNNEIIVKKSEIEVLESIAEGNKLVVMQDDEGVYFKASNYCDYVSIKVGLGWLFWEWFNDAFVELPKMLISRIYCSWDVTLTLFTFTQHLIPPLYYINSESISDESKTIDDETKPPTQGSYQSSNTSTEDPHFTRTSKVRSIQDSCRMFTCFKTASCFV